MTRREAILKVLEGTDEPLTTQQVADAAREHLFAETAVQVRNSPASPQLVRTLIGALLWLERKGQVVRTYSDGDTYWNRRHAS